MNQASRAGFVAVTDVSAAAGVPVVAGLAGMLTSVKSILIVCTADATVQLLDDDGRVVFPGAPYPARGGLNKDGLTMGLFSAKAKGKGIRVQSTTADPVTCVLEVYDNPA